MIVGTNYVDLYPKKASHKGEPDAHSKVECNSATASKVWHSTYSSYGAESAWRGL
jgi:hypothetical protein